MLVQIVEEVAQDPSHRGALGDLRPRRERRHHRHRRRPGRRLQDGEPQPPVVHRALPGRGDRRRRHPARRVHHGRASRRQPQRAPLRQPRPPADQAPGERRGGGHRRLRQLRRRPHGRRRVHVPGLLRRQHTGQRHDRGRGRHRQDLLFGGGGRRRPDRLRRLEDGARRHPRRDHGLGRVQRRFGTKTPHRAGRRSVHREASSGGLPGTDGHRRHRRHPGHGGGGADVLVLRDGVQGRRRRGAGPGPRAHARSRHERL